MKKKIYFFKNIVISLTIVFVIGLLPLGAQIIAPDFTLTDTKGETHNLYTELEKGKTVVLDFFTISCGSCSSGIPIVEEVWQNTGGNGNSLWVWGIESFYGNNDQIDSFINVNGGTYPCFSTVGNEALLALYQISYTPQYFVICPDKSMKFVSAENVQAAATECVNTQSSTNNLAFAKSEIKNISAKGSLQIEYSIRTNGKVRFEIFDLLGNELDEINIQTSKGIHNISLSSVSLKPGYYILRMYDNHRLADVRKFVVN